MSIVRQFLVAGNETTTNLMTQMMVRFADEPGGGPACVTIRRSSLDRGGSPAAHVAEWREPRRTTCDAEIGGATIPLARTCWCLPVGEPRRAGVPGPREFDPCRGRTWASTWPSGGASTSARGPRWRGSGEDRAGGAHRGGRQLRAGRPGPLQWNESFQLRAIRRLPLRVELDQAAERSGS